MVPMIISCPNCSTTYKVDNATLGPQGKSVRCSNCEQQWHQLPVKATPVQRAPAYTSQPQIQPTAIIDPSILQAQILAQMQAMVATNQIPQPKKIQSVTKPDPESIPESKQNINSKQEQVPEEDPPSQEELNDMFGTDEPEPPVSLVGDEDTEVNDDYTNLDDIPEPDPIPESLMSKDAYDEDSLDEDEDEDEDEDKSSTSIGLILGIVFLLLITGITAGGFFLRDMVQEVIPQTKPLYDMIGLSDPLGTGLDIQDVQSQREQDGQIDVLNVTGNIVNISEKLRMVPLIRISLFNEDNEEVQFINLTPDMAEIPAGVKMNFKGSINDPAEKAKKMEVTFTKPVVAE
jgi:predicted Zn finger-like uncharacterized protein